MNKPKILIIEEEATLAFALSEVLKSQGYIDIEIKYSATSAISAIQKQDYDIIFFDIMSGNPINEFSPDLFSSNHIFDKNTFFIFMTEYYDKNMLERLSQYRNNIVLQKPILSEEFWDALKIAELYTFQNDELFMPEISVDHEFTSHDTTKCALC